MSDAEEDAGAVVAQLPLAELPEGAIRRLPFPPYDILLANVGGSYLAIEDACPHSGRSLSEGRIEGEVDNACVVCPGHGWQIDLHSGAVKTEVGRGESNRVFAVRVEGDTLVVLATQKLEN